MWSACPPSRCEGPRRSLRASGAKLSGRSQMAHSATARTVAADARMGRDAVVRAGAELAPAFRGRASVSGPPDTCANLRDRPLRYSATPYVARPVSARSSHLLPKGSRLEKAGQPRVLLRRDQRLDLLDTPGRRNPLGRGTAAVGCRRAVACSEPRRAARSNHQAIGAELTRMIGPPVPPATAGSGPVPHTPETPRSRA
jgi:hypothetical protein